MIMDRAESQIEDEVNPNEDSMLLEGLKSDRSSKQSQVSTNDRLKQAEKLLITNLENLSTS